MNIKTYTIEEASNMLNIPESRIQQMISDGEIRSFKVGQIIKISEKELLDLSEKEQIPVPGPDIPQTASSAENSSASADPDQAEARDSYIICGQDPVLDMVWEELSDRNYPQPLGRSYVCSYQSLNALYFDEVKAAAAHMIDPNTNEYNDAYIHYLVPGTSCVRIHLTRRSQGFYVKKGNPKGIKDWTDLTRPDVKFMNREPGSGVRILIDARLANLGIRPSQVNGYSDVAHSHIAAASAVGRGDCDVSLGAKRVTSQVHGLEFIEMQIESYELVVKEASFMDPQIQDIVKLLQSGSIKDKIAQIDGYHPEDMGKITYVK